MVKKLTTEPVAGAAEGDNLYIPYGFSVDSGAKFIAKSRVCWCGSIGPGYAAVGHCNVHTM